MVVPDLILCRHMEILIFVDRDAPLVNGHVPVYMFGLWAIPINLIVWLGMTLEELEGPVRNIPRLPLPCLLDLDPACHASSLTPYWWHRRSLLLGLSSLWCKVALGVGWFSFLIFTGAEVRRSLRGVDKSIPHSPRCWYCLWRQAFSFLFGGWYSVEAITWEDVTGIEILQAAPVYIVVPEVVLGVAAWSCYRKVLAYSGMPLKILTAIFLTAVYTILALLSYAVLDRIFLAGAR